MLDARCSMLDARFVESISCLADLARAGGRKSEIRNPKFEISARIGGSSIQHRESSIGRAGRSPIVRRDRDRSGDPGTTRQALVIAAMLGRQNLAFLLSHRREILDTFHNLHTAEPAECDTVTRLTKPEPGLQHRIQETCFVNDSHLAARGLEMNGRHLDIELRKSHSSFRSAAARSSSSRKSGWEMSIRLRARSRRLRP